MRIARILLRLCAYLSDGDPAMWKLFGVLVFFFLSVGGALFVWPDQLAAQWNALKTSAEQQIHAELATFDQILSGKLKIGEVPTPPGKNAQPPILVAPPVSKPPAGQLKNQEKTRPLKAITPPLIEQTRTAPSVQQAAPSTPMAPAGGTPEAALGAILKHETRENQAKEETFWTQERIQEALKNGAPKSRSAPCIAFCDKNDTATEINMPKTNPDVP